MSKNVVVDETQALANQNRERLFEAVSDNNLSAVEEILHDAPLRPFESCSVGRDHYWSPGHLAPGHLPPSFARVLFNAAFLREAWDSDNCVMLLINFVREQGQDECQRLLKSREIPINDDYWSVLDMVFFGVVKRGWRNTARALVELEPRANLVIHYNRRRSTVLEYIVERKLDELFSALVVQQHLSLFLDWKFKTRVFKNYFFYVVNSKNEAVFQVLHEYLSEDILRALLLLRAVPNPGEWILRLQRKSPEFQARIVATAALLEMIRTQDVDAIGAVDVRTLDFRPCVALITTALNTENVDVCEAVFALLYPALWRGEYYLTIPDALKTLYPGGEDLTPAQEACFTVFYKIRRLGSAFFSLVDEGHWGLIFAYLNIRYSQGYMDYSLRYFLARALEGQHFEQCGRVIQHIMQTEAPADLSALEAHCREPLVAGLNQRDVIDVYLICFFALNNLDENGLQIAFSNAKEPWSCVFWKDSKFTARTMTALADCGSVYDQLLTFLGGEGEFGQGDLKYLVLKEIVGRSPISDPDECLIDKWVDECQPDYRIQDPEVDALVAYFFEMMQLVLEQFGARVTVEVEAGSSGAVFGPGPSNADL